MSILRACLNWRVLAAAAVLGLGIVIFAPGVAHAVVPLLIIAVCPISMVLMMRAMGDHGAQVAEPPSDQAGAEALRAQLAGLARRQEQLAREISALEGASSDPRVPTHKQATDHRS